MRKQDQALGQLGLFNETEIEANSSAIEPTRKDVAGYKRNAQKGHVKP